MTALTKDVSDAMTIDKIENIDTPPATPTTPEPPTPETFVEAEAHAAQHEPLAITQDVPVTSSEIHAAETSAVQVHPVPDVEPAASTSDVANPEIVKDTKAL